MERATHPAADGKDRTDRLLRAARVLGLAVLVWGAANQATITPSASGGKASSTTIVLLLLTIGAGWFGWLASRRLHAPVVVTFVSLGVLASAGGLLTGFAPLSLTFVAIAALGAAIAFNVKAAAAIGAIGTTAVLAATQIVSPSAIEPREAALESCAAVALGVLVGMSRRDYVARADQAEALLAARVRADVERDRSAALAERNRVAREVHDVLAHSLGALAVQLEAADALLEHGAETDKVRTIVRRARALAVEGLDETRQAVHALRDEPVALAEQLAALAQRSGASLTITGAPRPLDADVGLTLYRTAQEAVTNASKHAPGAPVELVLTFDASETTLIVSNGIAGAEASERTTAAALRETGGGFGLRGVRERVESIGGRVEVASTAVGFTVHVAVPS